MNDEVSFNPEMAAFVQVAKRLSDKGLLKSIATEKLARLAYEIAEDPDVIPAIELLILEHEKKRN
jgi:hypothetical protein